MKAAILSALLVCACSGEPALAFTGANEAGAAIATEAVATINELAGCEVLVDAPGRIRVQDDGDQLTLIDDAPHQGSPLNFRAFVLLTPTHDRKMAIVYKQVGLELGLRTTPDGAMQRDFSWAPAPEVAASLVELLREHDALPSRCAR